MSLLGKRVTTPVYYSDEEQDEDPETEGAPSSSTNGGRKRKRRRRTRRGRRAEVASSASPELSTSSILEGPNTVNLPTASSSKTPTPLVESNDQASNSSTPQRMIRIRISPNTVKNEDCKRHWSPRKDSPSLASSSSKSKGKGKAKEPIQPETSQAEVLALKGRLTSFEALASSIFSAVTCQICLDPMTKPFGLSPCGHTACYSCLVSWFRAVPPDFAESMPYNHDQAIDRQNPESLALHSPFLLHKKKTCPQCRSLVSQRPFEAWGMKNITELLRSSGLVREFDDLPQAANGSSADSQTRSDPWDGIFHRANNLSTSTPHQQALDALHRALTGSTTTQEVSNTGQPGYFFDEEDDVTRCSYCAHEVLDACCSGCGRMFAQLIQDNVSIDDDSDTSAYEFRPTTHFWNDSDSIGFGSDWDREISDDGDDRDHEEDGDFSSHGWGDFGIGVERVYPDAENDIEADDEIDYESSFIDDEGDAEAANDMLRESSGSETETVDDEPQSHPRSSPAPRADPSVNAGESNENYSEDDHQSHLNHSEDGSLADVPDPAEATLNRRRIRRSHTRVRFETSSDEDEYVAPRLPTIRIRPGGNLSQPANERTAQSVGHLNPRRVTTPLRYETDSDSS